MAEVDRSKGFLFDLDGVVYRGPCPIESGVQFVQQVAGWPHLFLTNNSSVTPGPVAEKLRGMGLSHVTERHVFTSAQATADWLGAQRPGFTYFAIGGQGIQEALAAAGTPDDRDPDFVVGEGPGLDYGSITKAINMLSHGRAKLVGTNGDVNIDTTIDGRSGVLPGGGALLAPIAVAAEVAEPAVIGKPNPLMYLEAVRRLGLQPKDCCMVGDRPDTDILGAARAGLRTVLVRTGRFGPGAPWKEEWPRPNFDVESLEEIDPPKVFVVRHDGTPRPDLDEVEPEKSRFVGLGELRDLLKDPSRFSPSGHAALSRVVARLDAELPEPAGHTPRQSGAATRATARAPKAGVIGIDFDGTIADTSAAKQEWALEHAGLRLSLGQCNRGGMLAAGMTRAEYDEMLLTVCGREHTLTAQPCPGALASVRELAGLADLCIVTDRGRFEHWLDWCRLWLQQHGLADVLRDLHSTEFAIPGGAQCTKQDVCKNNGIALLVDDDVANLRGLGPLTGIHYGRDGVVGHPVADAILHATHWRVIPALCRSRLRLAGS